MTYLTIDTLPDLSQTAMNAALPLTFVPFTTPIKGSDWDTSAEFAHRGPRVTLNDVFSFNAVSTAEYTLFSFSARQSPIKVYDMLGNAIAYDGYIDSAGTADTGGMDMLMHFVAPYSGKFYLSAGWNPLSSSPNSSVTVYADLNPAPILSNFITGTPGNDYLGFSTDANDYIDGGAGMDEVNFFGPRSLYNVVRNGGATTVTRRQGNEGSDVVYNVEKLEFFDGKGTSVALDLRYVDVTEALYVGYFGRAADLGGLASFQAQLAALDAPTTVGELNARYATDVALQGLVDSFGASSESNALYGGDNKGFVTAIYANLLNRAPDQSGLAFWSHAIDSGSLTRAAASLAIMAGAQANTTPQGRIDAQLLGVKLNVAANFTFALDMDNVGAAYDGAGPAAAVRAMLQSLSADTDIAAFQMSVQQVVGKMAKLPGVQSPLPDLAQANGEQTPITLTGIDSSHDGAAPFA